MSTCRHYSIHLYNEYNFASINILSYNKFSRNFLPPLAFNIRSTLLFSFFIVTTLKWIFYCLCLLPKQSEYFLSMVSYFVKSDWHLTYMPYTNFQKLHQKFNNLACYVFTVNSLLLQMFETLIVISYKIFSKLNQSVNKTTLYGFNNNYYWNSMFDTYHSCHT